MILARVSIIAYEYEGNTYLDQMDVVLLPTSVQASCVRGMFGFLSKCEWPRCAISMLMGLPAHDFSESEGKS